MVALQAVTAASSRVGDWVTPEHFDAVAVFLECCSTGIEPVPLNTSRTLAELHVFSLPRSDLSIVVGILDCTRSALISPQERNWCLHQKCNPRFTLTEVCLRDPTVLLCQKLHDENYGSAAICDIV